VPYSWTQYTYEALGRLATTDTTFAGSTIGTLHTETIYEYDEGNLKVTQFDGRSNATVTKYDEFGRVFEIQGPTPGTNGADGQPLKSPLTKFIYGPDGKAKEQIVTYVGAVTLLWFDEHLD